MSSKGEGRKLFPECPVLLQYILFGDYLRHPCWFANISVTEDKDLVGIKNRVAIFIEEDKLVAVFLFDLFAEFPDAGLLSLFLPFVLLIHPGSKNCGEGHSNEGEINMGSESIGVVSSWSLYEPSLLGFPKQSVFDFTSGIITLIDPNVRITMVWLLGLFCL